MKYAALFAAICVTIASVAGFAASRETSPPVETIRSASGYPFRAGEFVVVGPAFGPCSPQRDYPAANGSLPLPYGTGGC